MNDQPQVEFKVDKNNLYREETYTDLKMATIRCVIPVNGDGSEDSGRETLFMGSTQLMTPQGPIPIQSRLEGKTMDEAMENFPQAMQAAMQKVFEELKRYQQAQKKDDSRIIVPGR